MYNEFEASLGYKRVWPQTKTKPVLMEKFSTHMLSTLNRSTGSKMAIILGIRAACVEFQDPEG